MVCIVVISNDPLDLPQTPKGDRRAFLLTVVYIHIWANYIPEEIATLPRPSPSDQMNIFKIYTS